MKSVSLACLAALALPPGAQAQSLPTGFYINGHASLSYGGSAGYGGDPFISADTDLGWSNGTFGIDVSLIGFAFEDGSNTATYAALTYTFGEDHKLSLGIPRPAYEAHEQFVMNDYLGPGGAFGGLGGSGSILTNQRMFFGYTPYTILGLRYDGHIGASDLAVSLHGSPDGAGYLVSASARAEVFSGVLSGGVEHLNVDGTRLTAAKIHFARSLDRLSLASGLVLTNLDASDPGYDQRLGVLELAADYAFDQHWSAGALVVHAVSFGGSSLTLTGARGRYAFGNGLMAEAVVFDVSGGGATQYALNLRYDF